MQVPTETRRRHPPNPLKLERQEVLGVGTYASKGLIAEPFQPAIFFFKRAFLPESPPPSIELFHSESCAIFSLSWENMKKCLFFLGRALTTHQSNHPTQVELSKAVDLEVLTGVE